MIDNESLSDTIDSLHPEYFYKREHQKIFEAIVKLFNNTQPVDILTVTEELKKIHINSLAIMPNDTENYPEDSYEQMKIFADKNNFNFPYLIDESQEIAKSYGAVCTPDFFGYNKYGN